MAEEQWFYADVADTMPRGPVVANAVRGLLDSGALPRTARVWCEGMTDWQPVDAVEQFTRDTTAPINSTPVAAMPVAARPAELAYETPIVPTMAFAGFWIRFIAWMIDYIIILAVGALVSIIIDGFDSLGGFSAVPSISVHTLRPATFLLGWAYFSILESSKLQATLGKKALGVRVVNESDQRIGFGRATARYFAKYLSILTIGIGYMMAGWTRKKQGLHDVVAGTLVVR